MLINHYAYFIVLLDQICYYIVIIYNLISRYEIIFGGVYMVKFYNNLTVKWKLTLCFLVVIALNLASFFYACTALFALSKDFQEIQTIGVTFLYQLETMQTELLGVRGDIFQLLSKNDSALVDNIIERNERINANITSLIDYSEKNTIEGIDLSTLEEIHNEIITKYNPTTANALSYMDSGQPDKAIKEAIKISEEVDHISADIYKMSKGVYDFSRNMVSSTNKSVKINFIFLGISVIISSIFSILVIAVSGGMFTKRLDVVLENLESIKHGDLSNIPTSEYTDEIGTVQQALHSTVETIQSILDDTKHIVVQNQKGNLNNVIDESIYEGAYLYMVKTINNGFNDVNQDLTLIASTLGSFADGNFDVDIRDYPGEKERISSSMHTLKNNLINVNAEIQSILDESIKGNLNITVDSSKLKGDWATLLDSLQNLLNEIIKPFNEINMALDNASKGNLSYEISEDYQGDFKKISQTFNFTLREIRKYISEIDRTLNEMSNDNLNTSINREFLGEFNSIKSSINHIISKYNDIFRNFTNATEEVSSNALQMQDSNMSLAECAKTQVAHLKDFSDNITAVEKIAEENAESSSKANIIAKKTNTSANSGNEVMHKMLDSMNDISNSSNEISNIIKVIEDIAFQTNLLALNAAVEAARAGQHGKGFAVVAEEVRNLASRSANAAKDTTALINSNLEKIDYGSKLAKETSIAFEEILSGVDDVSNIVESINQSSNDQSSSIGEISKSLNIFSETINETFRASEEGAAMSQELSSQSNELRALMDPFKLKK